MYGCSLLLFYIASWFDFFNESNEILLGKQVIIDRSIVYNMDEQDELDTFISALPEKDRYLYAAFDSVENVPDFCREIMNGMVILGIIYQTIWGMNFNCPYPRTT